MIKQKKFWRQIPCHLSFKTGLDEILRNIQAEAREFASYKKYECKLPPNNHQLPCACTAPDAFPYIDCKECGCAVEYGG